MAQGQSIMVKISGSQTTHSTTGAARKSMRTVWSRQAEFPHAERRPLCCGRLKSWPWCSGRPSSI